jgi:hypothetical protein
MLMVVPLDVVASVQACAAPQYAGSVTERAERKSLDAAEFEAQQFFRGVGGDAMSDDDRAEYERMWARVDAAEERLRAARDSD